MLGTRRGAVSWIVCFVVALAGALCAFPSFAVAEPTANISGVGDAGDPRLLATSSSLPASQKIYALLYEDGSFVVQVGSSQERGRTLVDKWPIEDGLSFLEWYDKAPSVTTVTVKEGVAPEETNCWFYRMSSCTSIDLSGLDSSRVTNMNFMFKGCSSLKSIDVTGLDTSNVVTMRDMFANCTSLASVNVSRFNTAKVTDFSGMFSNCKSLTSLNLSGFNTRKATTKSKMFSGCTSLTKVQVGANGNFRGVFLSRNASGQVIAWRNASGTVYASSLLPTYRAATYTRIVAKSLAKATVKVASKKVYTGKAVKPGVSVKLGGKSLKKGVDYTVSYKKNKNIGTASVTVTGKGLYTGSVSKTFKIVPPSTSIKKLMGVSYSKSLAGAGIGIVLKKRVVQADGYVIRVATSKTFKNAKKYVVKGSRNTKVKTGDGIKRGKTYYVQVRTYKKTGGKTYYSSWSAAKSVKVG